jgi:membrane protein
MSKPRGTPESSRAQRAAAAAWSWGPAAAGRGTRWIEARDPASRTGAAVGCVRRYRAADGQLYALLLAAYFFLTVLPTMIVEASYVYSDPNALANRVERRLGLSGATADLFRTVLVGAGTHRFLSVLLAILNVVVFGIGFGRVLQLAHARSWGIDLRGSRLIDQARYLSVLLAMIALVFLFVLETKLLVGHSPWLGRLIDVVWLGVLIGFFVWAPRLLLHRRVSARALLPGAMFTVLGLIAMRLISTLLLVRWLDSYSMTYGALGIVMAIFFWIIAEATVLVIAAALSPALAARRDLIEARL